MYITVSRYLYICHWNQTQVNMGKEKEQTEDERSFIVGMERDKRPRGTICYFPRVAGIS